MTKTITLMHTEQEINNIKREIMEGKWGFFPPNMKALDMTYAMFILQQLTEYRCIEYADTLNNLFEQGLIKAHPLYDTPEHTQAVTKTFDSVWQQVCEALGSEPFTIQVILKDRGFTYQIPTMSRTGQLLREALEKDLNLAEVLCYISEEITRNIQPWPNELLEHIVKKQNSK